MTGRFPQDALRTAPPRPRQVRFEDQFVQPDLNRHIAIAWTRLAGRPRGSAATSRVTVLKPFAL